MRKRFLLLFTLLSGVCFAAELSLPTVFSDHMVLQRDQAVPVWGKADPKSVVTVEFAGQTKTAVTSDSGKWQVILDPMSASAESRELIITASIGNQKSTFSDVLVGEVWLCSGQSNMEMPLKGFNLPTDNAAEVIAAATLPTLRLYKTPKVASGVPKDRIDASWARCTPETAAEFSATAFYFGRKILQDLNVPVGLLQSAWGGTRIEPWTPPCGFEGIESLSDIYKLTHAPLQLPEKSAQQTPTALYNGMLAAHIPFAIKGAIWYQGESNRGEGMLYAEKTRALLNGWHKLWGYNFPYYFVQIAPYQYGSEPGTRLPEFWEAQSEIVKTIPKTGMAVVTDCTLLNDIHPTNKEAPGTRLALLAEANTYGMDVVSAGPVFQSLEKKGDKLTVKFDSAKGLTTRDGKAPDWFEIAGSDGVFKPATAKIKGDRVILGSSEIRTPKEMRFGWNKLATPNLMNATGLPCGAFRAAIN